MKTKNHISLNAFIAGEPSLGTYNVGETSLSKQSFKMRQIEI